MIKITEHNYEAFMQDYLDNNLDAGMRMALQEFLDSNPDVKAEINSLESVKLSPPQNITYSNKVKIQVPQVDFQDEVSKRNIYAFLIANNENDLNPEQKLKLNSFLQKNTDYKKETKYFEKVYLKPNTGISCPKKEKLYARTNRSLLFRNLTILVSGAAAIALLFVFFITREKIPESLSEDNIVMSVPQNLMKETEPVHQKSLKNNDKTVQKQVKNIETKVTIKEEATRLPFINDIVKLEQEQLTKIDLKPIDLLENEIQASIIQNISDIKIKQNFEDRTLADRLQKEKIGLSLKQPFDLNKDQKVHYWEIIKLATNTLNRITGDTIVNFSFTSEGKLTELALIDDKFKISKSSKN